jgi:hypothetical protein
LIYIERGSTEIFPNICPLEEHVTFIPLIAEHLNTLHKKFGEYFQTRAEEWNWIRDPFSVGLPKRPYP